MATLAIVLGLIFGAVGVFWFYVAWLRPKLKGHDPVAQAVKEEVEPLKEEMQRVRETVKELKEAFNHWRATPGDEELGRLARERGRRENLGRAAALAREGKNREAIPYLQACLTPEPAPLAQAAIHLLMGNAYLAVSELAQAEGHYREALGLAEAVGDEEARAATTGNLGLVYFQKGELDKALEHHGKALEMHTRIDNPLGQAAALGNLGLVYAQKGELDKALEHHGKALEMHTRIGNPLGQANQLGNLGLVYFQKGELDKALEHLERAAAIFEKVGARAEMDTAKRNIQRIKDSQAKGRGG